VGFDGGSRPATGEGHAAGVGAARAQRANPRPSAVAPAKADGDASLRQGYGWQASQGALGL